MFQFQSGTIKASQARDGQDDSSMFQFQSGTIKAIQVSGGLVNDLLFQFQSGTIKALDRVLSKLANFGFNSNLVRLKHSQL